MCPFVGKTHKLCRKKEYIATDLNTYNKILTAKHIDALSKCNDKDSREIGKLLLINDIVRYKVAWYADLIKDFIVFLRLHHPFFSMFYGHDLHIISRRERTVIFFANIMLQFGNLAFLTLVISDSNVESDDDTIATTDDCNDTPDTGSFGTIILRIMASILFALLGLVCNVTLFIAAGCQCVEFNKNETLRCICNCCFGNFCLSIVTLIVFMWFFVWALVFFPSIYDDLSCNTSERDGALFVFFAAYVSALFQTYFIFYTIVDWLIFYPNWKKQTGQTGYNLFDYQYYSESINICGLCRSDVGTEIADSVSKSKDIRNIKHKTLMTKRIIVDSGYLAQRKIDYENKLHLKTDEIDDSSHSCVYYCCCGLYCFCCFSCWCLTMCVKLISQKRDKADNGGKPSKDIFDVYGNVIGKNKKEFGITYYEFQLFDKNGDLNGAMPREFTRIAQQINADIESFCTAGTNTLNSNSSLAVSSVTRDPNVDNSSSIATDNQEQNHDHNINVNVHVAKETELHPNDHDAAHESSHMLKAVGEQQPTIVPADDTESDELN